MNYNEILESLKNKNSVLVCCEDGNEFNLFRNDKGLWRRKIWGAWAYLNDDEMTKELFEDYEVNYIF